MLNDLFGAYLLVAPLTPHFTPKYGVTYDDISLPQVRLNHEVSELYDADIPSW